MAELVRTNDPGVISVIEGLLAGADIPYQVTDRNMSVLEGSISAIQIRILVRDDDEETLDLLTKTEGGRAAVAHQKKIDELTHAAVG